MKYSCRYSNRAKVEGSGVIPDDGTEVSIGDELPMIPNMQFSVFNTAKGHGAARTPVTAFIPDQTLSVSVRDQTVRLRQNGVNFFTFEATEVEFQISVRKIIQHENLNPALSALGQKIRVVHSDVKKQLSSHLLRCPTDLIGHIRDLLSADLVVAFESYYLVDPDDLSVVATADNKVNLTSLSNGFASIELKKFIKLIVEPKDYYFHSRKYFQVYLNICSWFKQLDLNLANPGPLIANNTRSNLSLNAIVRRAFELARFGIFWIAAFEYFFALLHGAGPDVIAILNSLRDFLLIKMPVNTLAITPSGQAEIDQAAPHAPADEAAGRGKIYLSDPNFRADYVRNSDKRFLEECVYHIVGDYENLRGTEASLNISLWTPIFSCLFLTNSEGKRGNLTATVEYPLGQILKFGRNLRVDFAIEAKGLPPLFLAEYATALFGRGHKDWDKIVLEAATDQLRFVGRNIKNENKHGLLKKLFTVVAVVAGSEVQFGIVRPAFDPEMNMKGFRFSTNKAYTFNLVGEDQADVVFDENLFDNGVNIQNSGVFDEDAINQDVLRIIEGMIRDFHLPRYEVPGRKTECPTTLRPEDINFNAVRFIRQIGLFFNGFYDGLGVQVGDDGDDDENAPPVAGFIFEPGLQASEHFIAIPGLNTPGIATTNLHQPTPKRPKFDVLHGLLYGSPYYASAKLVKSRENAMILTSQTVDQSLPRHAVFFLKVDEGWERVFWTDLAPDLRGSVPTVTFKPVLLKKGLVFWGLERLVPFSKIFGQGWNWPSKIRTHLAKFVVDTILGISELSQKNWLHGNISLENVMYSRKDKCWKLTGFSCARSIGVKCDEDHLGTLPHVDPTVEFHGALKSIQSDLWSLGSVLEELLNEQIYPALRDPRACAPEFFVTDLKSLEEFAAFLKGHPSVLAALERLQEIIPRFLGSGKRFKLIGKAVRRLCPKQSENPAPLAPSNETGSATPSASSSDPFPTAPLASSSESIPTTSVDAALLEMKGPVKRSRSFV